MRLLLDENLSPRLATSLRSTGADVISVHEIGLSGRPDTDVWAEAVNSQRACVTYDVRDFSLLASDDSKHGRHHPGVVAISPRSISQFDVGTQLRALNRLIASGRSLENTVTVLKR